MNGRTTTSEAKKVVMVCGSHTITGYADDSFLVIEPKGEGILAKSGCDGEVARAIDPDSRSSIKITLLQNSQSNAWLQAMHNKDRKTGEGLFPVLIKDLRGGLVLSADSAWVLKAPSRTFGKDTNNREWTIETGPSETTE